MYTCTRFLVHFSHFFGHHSIKDKAEVQNITNIFIIIQNSPTKCDFHENRIVYKNAPFHHAFLAKMHCFTPHFGEFHSAYPLKMRNFASFLNMLYSAKSAQFYSVFFADNN
jgi:hypothetical protein